ncbi:hypothetical protein NW754_014403 [Fusarium falciforme]|uniref:Uncharacterized protein n=1 Tax=Fusarium falciforme TaxID=195108 RepID=A0A9W8UXI1_9HYPO|nr:hypothetical protein NW754_014403 [Fusarium falciforme]KAJ4181749.1 hypothetical protein NW755_010747 [Fusarium falciforme]KAJ4196068.1 hypothetical protein NW767_009527 [Fusarium falciforme]
MEKLGASFTSFYGGARHVPLSLVTSSNSPKCTSFPWGRLFDVDQGNPLKTSYALQRIRHRIYSFVWSQDRQDPDDGDFIVTRWGVRRNLSRHYPRSFIDVRHDLTLLHHDTGLLFANAATSKDFTEYIYGVSKVEIPITATYDTIQSVQNGGWRPHDDEDMLVHNLYTNKRHFEEHAKNVDVVIIFQEITNDGAFYDADMHLDEIRYVLNYWDIGAKGGELRVIVNYATNHVTDLELETAAFPFFPLAFTG